MQHLHAKGSRLGDVEGWRESDAIVGHLDLQASGCFMHGDGCLAGLPIREGVLKNVGEQFIDDHAARQSDFDGQFDLIAVNNKLNFILELPVQLRRLLGERPYVSRRR